MNFIGKYLKAHLAGIGAALTLVVADLNTGNISLNDWYGIIGAALGVGAAVAVVPNTNPVAAAPVEAVQPPAAVI